MKTTFKDFKRCYVMNGGKFNHEKYFNETGVDLRTKENYSSESIFAGIKCIVNIAKFLGNAMNMNPFYKKPKYW